MEIFFGNELDDPRLDGVGDEPGRDVGGDEEGSKEPGKEIGVAVALPLLEKGSSPPVERGALLSGTLLVVVVVDEVDERLLLFGSEEAVLEARLSVLLDSVGGANVKAGAFVDAKLKLFVAALGAVEAADCSLLAVAATVLLMALASSRF